MDIILHNTAYNNVLVAVTLERWRIALMLCQETRSIQLGRYRSHDLKQQFILMVIITNDNFCFHISFIGRKNISVHCLQFQRYFESSRLLIQWMIHIWRPRKLSNFQDPNSLAHLRPKLNLLQVSKPQVNLLPLQMITSQLKENIIQGWVLYVIRSFFQVCFRFQNQFINFVSPSFDFFSFSWSLTICFFVALYSCVCSCQLWAIIEIFITVLCLNVEGSNKMHQG